jgi:hypothetical protein
MVSAAKVASFWRSRARPQRHERAPSREEALPRAQAEAAFLDAVRGGQPAPRISQVRALDDAELRRVARRLRRLRSQRGRKAGAWSMTVALIAAPVLAAIRGASGPAGAVVLALLCAAFVTGAAVAGKVITVAACRLRWRIYRDQVLRRLAERGTDGSVGSAVRSRPRVPDGSPVTPRPGR